MLVAVQCTDAEFANFHYYFILVSKFDLGLLNAYKLIYFKRNVNGNKGEKILEDDRGGFLQLHSIMKFQPILLP